MVSDRDRLGISGSPVTVTDPSGRPLQLAHRAASDRGGRVAEPGEGLAGAASRHELAAAVLYQVLLTRGKVNSNRCALDVSKRQIELKGVSLPK